MTTTFNIPVTVLDERCRTCFDLDLSGGITHNDIWADGKIVAREFSAHCSHLVLCNRLKERYSKKEDTANE